MRIWSFHPKYLDAKGLVAAWREALLAQKVLLGRTKGYRNHPQLQRFKEQADPLGAISVYLRELNAEASSRGYSFDAGKIKYSTASDFRITVTIGQLTYEWKHLKRKLWQRDRAKHRELREIRNPELHPLFISVRGDVEKWEIRK